jgi:hypothetical protein
MTLTNRLGIGTMRMLTVAAVAMGLALGASAQFNTAPAHASGSDASVWIQETKALYSSVWPAYGAGVTGADCYMDANFVRSVRVNRPAVQARSVAANYIVWVRLFNANTLAVSSWLQVLNSTFVPANSGPWSLGFDYTITDSAGYFGTSPIKAQVYVGIYYPNTNVLMDSRLLTVTQYSVWVNNNGRTNLASC